MGKLITEDKLIKNNIEHYLDRSTSEYTRFLETTPNFVTYYQKDRLESSYDNGLENVENFLGKDSPMKFNKIENLPLYGLDTITLMLERGDTGLNTVFEGEAILLPNTVKPSSDDFFTFGYINDIYIFRIIGVSNDSIKNSPFYRLTFSLTKKVAKEEYVEQFTVDEYVSIFDNIGTQYDSVIRKKDYMVVEFIDELVDSLIDTFVTDFYDRHLNIMSYEIRGYLVYNRMLNKFLTDNNLLKREKTIMKDLYLVDIIKGKSVGFSQMYKCSLYNAVQRKDRRQHICHMAILHKIGQENTIFTHYGLPEVYEMILTDAIRQPSFCLFDHDMLCKIGCCCYDPFPDTEEFLLRNIIVKYMWDKLEIDIDLLERINDLDLYPNIETYALLPIIIFILKEYRNKIIINIDKKLIIAH